MYLTFMQSYLYQLLNVVHRKFFSVLDFIHACEYWVHICRNGSGEPPISERF